MQLCGRDFAKMADQLRAWSPGIQDQVALRGMIAHMENLSATLENRAVRSTRQVAEADVRAALLSIGSQGEDNTEKLIDLALGGLAKDPSSLVPYASNHKVSTDLFRFDLAYCMWLRDRSLRKVQIRYGSADSSPHGPFDLFVFRYLSIDADRIVEVFKAMKLLATTSGGSQAGDQDDDEVSFTLRRQRRAANKVLHDFIRDFLAYCKGKLVRYGVL